MGILTHGWGTPGECTESPVVYVGHALRQDVLQTGDLRVPRVNMTTVFVTTAVWMN